MKHYRQYQTGVRRRRRLPQFLDPAGRGARGAWVEEGRVVGEMAGLLGLGFRLESRGGRRQR